MRILYSAVILAVFLAVGCGNKTATATTKPPAPAGGAAAAPAPAPAAAPAPVAAAGRQGGGAAAAPVTVETHAATMKQIATSNASLGKMIKSNDLMGAVTEAQNLSNLFATIERFYTQRNKPDAVKLAQTGRTGAADVVAAAKAGDPMKAQQAQLNVGGTCKQCHGVYREGDAQTGYKFKADSGLP